MKKSIVLFDIDYTLFDARVYKQAMFELIAQFIEDENKEAVYKTLDDVYFSHRDRIGYFDLKIMLEEMVQKVKIETNIAAILEAIMQDERSYQMAVYEETVEVLETAAKQKDLSIGIFSGGQIAHQKRKLAPFFHLFHKDHINIPLIKHKQIAEVMKKYKNNTLFLIDDVLEILYNAKKLHTDITTIWIKRGRFAENPKVIKGFTPDFTIYNLREVIPILESRSKS